MGWRRSRRPGGGAGGRGLQRACRAGLQLPQALCLLGWRLLRRQVLSLLTAGAAPPSPSLGGAKEEELQLAPWQIKQVRHPRNPNVRAPVTLASHPRSSGSALQLGARAAEQRK